MEFNPIIFELESFTTSKDSMIFSLIVIFISAIIQTYLSFKTYKTASIVSSFESVIKKVFFIELMLTLRTYISFVDYFIWYSTEGELSLNGLYETVTWIPVLGLTFYLIYSRILLVLPKRSIFSRQVILISLLLLIVLWVIFGFIINLQEGGKSFEIMIWITSFVIISIIAMLIYLEFSKINKGINKMRLNLMTGFFMLIAVYMGILIIGYGQIPSLFPNAVVSASYHSVLVFLITLIPLGCAIMFYWIIHVPNFIRKRRDISTIVETHKSN